MKYRNQQQRQQERGIALVVTLIMLSVITFTAVAFLFLSRTERSAVTVSTDLTDAKMMADHALGRAQAELAARMMANDDLLVYDHMVSTNYINPFGYTPGNTTTTNVNFSHRVNGQLLTQDDWIQNIANLQFNGRVPVFVETNANAPLDFRFYYDVNQNGLFETNGALPVIVTNTPSPQFLTTNGTTTQFVQDPAVVTNRFAGDPEWNGVLAYPDQKHSGSNQFLGRFAYMVLPAGKSLDLNYIHNQSKQLQPDGDGYYRNQGYGSWELNLAAFLSDLNTNLWPSTMSGSVPSEYFYNLNHTASSRGQAFLDALSILRHRYNPDFTTLLSVEQIFGTAGATEFSRDFVDGHADGPLMTGLRLNFDNDAPGKPWAGSDNPRPFHDIQQLYQSSPLFGNVGDKLKQQQSLTGAGDYERYTFHRLLGQMGVDSSADLTNKINLNYAQNQIGLATNLTEWTPLQFFTNVADRLIRQSILTNVATVNNTTVTNYLIGETLVRPDISLTNIMVWPTNEYSASVHRLLQVAANIYDFANHQLPTNSPPYYPHVYRPLFTRSGTNVFITAFEEVSTRPEFFDQTWVDVSQDSTQNNVPGRDAINTPNSEVNVFGIGCVVGAKKGYPNFNELTLTTMAKVTRKLELIKDRSAPGFPNVPPVATNQMYVLSVSNRFGIESWNSYSNAYPRTLFAKVTNSLSMVLSNQNRMIWPETGQQPFLSTTFTNYFIPADSWSGKSFQVPINRMEAFLPTSAYRTSDGTFVSTAFSPKFESNTGFPLPQWSLFVTGRVQYLLVDEPRSRRRVVDVVNIAGVTNLIDITRELVRDPRDAQDPWLAARPGNSTNINVPTLGIINQIEISRGNIANANWQSVNPQVGDKEGAIERFRAFLDPSFAFTANPGQAQRRAATNNTPFNPSRIVYAHNTLQVNDPLVHYTLGDIYDASRTNTVDRIQLNQQIPFSNLGQVNERYRPWGEQGTSTDNNTRAFNLALKDPLIRSSDDWTFTTEAIPSDYPNIGWLGRVHRGSPWQTIYLKSPVADMNTWRRWAGSNGTHPTNDWRLLELFTVAPNDNAARGLLSVNQTNMAAWSAVLSGVLAFTNVTDDASLLVGNESMFETVTISPGSPELKAIVEGINQTRAGFPNRRFHHLGEILSTPQLTAESPFLNRNSPAQLRQGISDFAYERIPQQILSLLREDVPRVVIYAFGQSLKPAPDSLLLSGPFRGMSTNYQITGEVATKAVVRFEGSPANPKAVIESYHVLQPE